MKRTCEVCGKAFEGARAEGALRLHKIKTGHGSSNCSHPNKRVLNPRDTREKKAMEVGYVDMCPDCGEVFE